jgi:hypothetical protein
MRLPAPAGRQRVPSRQRRSAKLQLRFRVPGLDPALVFRDSGSPLEATLPPPYRYRARIFSIPATPGDSFS